MSLQDTVSAERVHIGFFGLRNAGKSSLVNAVTGQSVSLVSDVKGTTTDPVRKAMELLPLGPVLILDTPGLDDEGVLGEMRVQRARDVMRQTDVAVLVCDSTAQRNALETQLLDSLRERNIPTITAMNKCDLLGTAMQNDADTVFVSAKTGYGVPELKQRLASLASSRPEKPLVSDLYAPGDCVVLVTPIDAAAPKGRMILPQQQTMRDILDYHGVFLTVQPEELPGALAVLSRPPKLVITDSQAFARVDACTPPEIPLTSFSILFARYKGSLPTLVRGAAALSALRSGDHVLISEGCTHHRQCGDIGTEKMPAWIRAFTGVELSFAFTSGRDFPEDLQRYALVVHCGGCMLNAQEMGARMAAAQRIGVPIVNYGVAIAHMHGILRRSLRPFEGMEALLDF